VKGEQINENELKDPGFAPQPGKTFLKKRQNVTFNEILFIL
jgi:hypothetical protein